MFTGCILDKQGCQVSFSCRQRIFWSDWAVAQADLNLRWEFMSQYTFCLVEARMLLISHTCCFYFFSYLHALIKNGCLQYHQHPICQSEESRIIKASLCKISALRAFHLLSFQHFSESRFLLVALHKSKFAVFISGFNNNKKKKKTICRNYRGISNFIRVFGLRNIQLISFYSHITKWQIMQKVYRRQVFNKYLFV